MTIFESLSSVDIKSLTEEDLNELIADASTELERRASCLEKDTWTKIMGLLQELPALTTIDFEECTYVGDLITEIEYHLKNLE